MSNQTKWFHSNKLCCRNNSRSTYQYQDKNRSFKLIRCNNYIKKSCCTALPLNELLVCINRYVESLRELSLLVFEICTGQEWKNRWTVNNNNCAYNFVLKNKPRQRRSHSHIVGWYTGHMYRWSSTHILWVCTPVTCTGEVVLTYRGSVHRSHVQVK